MSKRIFPTLFVASLLVAFTAAASETAPRSLRQTELLALVAGNALPENIVNEIHTRGVAFRMDDSFRARLTTAGATPSILAALDAAKAPAKVAAEDKPDPALLQHITAAAKFMKDKQYDEAADELASTLKGNFEKFEIGFVMGELLRQQERWAEAVAVYTEVLKESPDFPEAHTHLSYALHRVGEFEAALREAKAELARTPENAEAHRCAGVALGDLRKYDASEAEYREALRIKPDFALVHYDLGVDFFEKGDREKAIAEYKKTLTLDAGLINARYNLANLLQEKGEFDSAIREFREAKRLAPNRFDVRMNLSVALVDAGLYPQAIIELRELEVIAPDSAMCHQHLGQALYLVSDFTAAEGEYRKADALDPSDPDILLGLGAVLENQNHLETALQEYRRAEELDDSSGHAHQHAGRVLLTLKRVNEALKELKQAEDLAPSDGYTHDLYAQALLLSGDSNAAVTEFKESLALNAKQANVRLELAAALEKKGDWVSALDQYRQAAVDDNVDPAEVRPGTSVRVYGAAQKYSEAKERFNQHLASLRKAGKSSEAAQLEKTLSDAQSTTSATQKLDSLMQSGSQAFTERRFDDSERDYKQALTIAEKIQPLDGRLTTILGHLGQLAAFRQDFTAAEAVFERQLKVTEQIYGSQNAALADPLKWLAMNAMAQKDFPSAKRFLDRALDVNRKVYGENSAGYVDILRILGGAYLYQEAYDKAEPYLVQATEIERKLYDYDPRYGGYALMNLATLCTLYDHWGKPDKLEPCDRQLISAIDKQQLGPDTSFLEQTLTREAKTLRTLGRPEDAAKIEQRLKTLQPAAANSPNN